MLCDMRPDRVGWTVYDVYTGRPIFLDQDVPLTELEHEAADRLVALLNRGSRPPRARRLSYWPVEPASHGTRPRGAVK
jgi:hypothetical protein